MTSLLTRRATDEDRTDRFAHIGREADYPVGKLRMINAGGRRLAVARTSAGMFVTDNACPHEGQSLVQGEAGDGYLTCTWHNWKYRMADGHCVVGEEDIRVYAVQVVDGDVIVDLTDPPNDEKRPKLLASLRRALDNNYAGQMARDIVRLLRAEADPVQLVWEAVAWGAPRAEFGFGHALASLTDCLQLSEQVSGDARALPIAQAFAGVAENERLRPLRPQPEPVAALPAEAAAQWRCAMECQDLALAEGLLRGAIAAGREAGELQEWLIGAASDHHLSYGHGAIYVQKAFSLLERLGWDRADAVLPHLVPALGYGNREDTLPYMRPFMKKLAGVDYGALAEAEAEPGWTDGGSLRAAMLGRDGAALAERATQAVRTGLGVTGLLDAVTGVACHRLLKYDPRPEVVSDAIDFGWLDITHVLTYTAAARWAWQTAPGPDTARLALFTAFLASYAGRKGYVEATDSPDPSPPSADELCRAALEDRAGSFIVS
ncbi:MAG TPA: Rieske 2Fe-2S domain-containing protein, partial [Acidimicrobiales bacterium]|nr:Rieske 2Fe-2S domain-containing protein [Acidimicrobiales bacterium]